jgi:ATPase subunit of ABC transporter with duplicated ATPase domains
MSKLKNIPSQTQPPKEPPLAPPRDERPSAPANFPKREAEERRGEPRPIDELIAPVMARIENKAKQSGFRFDEAKWSELERRHERDRILQRANLSPKHLTAAVLWTPHSDWTHAFEVLRAKLGLGCLCALIGPRGTGKTQLAIELAKANAEALRSVRYHSMVEVFLAVKESYHGEQLSEAQVIARFLAPSLLILDEAQERAETAWEDRLITYLVDKRYQHEKDTLIISNLLEQYFRDSLGSSIISRLEETGGIIQCTWKSFRR